MTLFVGYKKYNTLIKELDLTRERYNEIKKENEDFKGYITDLVRQNKKVKEELSWAKSNFNIAKYNLEEQKRDNQNLHDDYLNKEIEIQNLKCKNKDLERDLNLYKSEAIEIAKKSMENAKKYKTVRIRKKKLKQAELDFLDKLVNLFIESAKQEINKL